MDRIKVVFFFAFVLVTTIANPAMAADPPDKTVRVFYIQPTDVADNPKYATGIASVMKSAQKYFLDQCNFTFKLNDPVCEVVKGTHPRSWYENTQNASDKYWWAVYNGREDLLNLLPSVKADNNRKRWKIVYYIDAEGDGAGGGGGDGWVLLPKHDADGALGYPKDTARWVGGMSHELGHCFGLPDAAATDGTVMSASLYNWPNCTITPAMTATIKNLSANTGFWFTEIATGINPAIPIPFHVDSRPLRFNRHNLLVKSSVPDPLSATVGLYDIVGRKPTIECIRDH